MVGKVTKIADLGTRDLRVKECRAIFLILFGPPFLGPQRTKKKGSHQFRGTPPGGVCPRNQTNQGRKRAMTERAKVAPAVGKGVS